MYKLPFHLKFENKHGCSITNKNEHHPEEAYNNNFTFYDKPTLRIVPELILCDEQGNIFQVQ